MKEIRLKIEDTKAAERLIIEKLRDAFKGTGLYLESLFTVKFCNWVAMHIKDDISPDIMEWAFDRSNEIELEKQVRQLQYDQGHINNLLKNLEAHRDEKIIQVDELQQEVKKWKQHATDATYRANQLAEENERSDAENFKLKAHLYDLIVGTSIVEEGEKI